jgi:proteasome lid subunit RPN8/RPN11
MSLMVDAHHDLYTAKDDAYPEEGVGIITADAVVYPLINQARSHERFIVNEKLVHEAQMELIEQGHAPVAFYHTHPTSPSSPSARDELWLEEHPDQVMLIVGHKSIAGWVWIDRLHSLGKIPK